MALARYGCWHINDYLYIYVYKAFFVNLLIPQATVKQATLCIKSWNQNIQKLKNWILIQNASKIFPKHPFWKFEKITKKFLRIFKILESQQIWSDLPGEDFPRKCCLEILFSYFKLRQFFKCLIFPCPQYVASNIMSHRLRRLWLLSERDLDLTVAEDVTSVLLGFVNSL